MFLYLYDMKLKIINHSYLVFIVFFFVDFFSIFVTKFQVS